MEKDQKSSLTLLLLALNLEESKNGESTLGKLILDVLTSDYSFQPLSLKYSVDTLKKGKADDHSIQSIWSYLDRDQQQLLLSHLLNKS